MGVSLTYTLVDHIEPDLWKRIKEEQQRLLTKHEWWCEPINFYGSMEIGKSVFGDTKFFLMGYTSRNGAYVEVNEDESMFMAYRDLKFIVDTLSDWSKRFGATWLLSLEDDVLGKITPESIDPGVRSMLGDFAKACRVHPESPGAEAIAKEISDRHKDRWGR